jgi:hypothetical protein
MGLAIQKRMGLQLQVNKMNSLRKTLALFLLLVSLSGCRIRTSTTPMIDEYCYYLNPSKDLSAIGRVAIVELNNNSNFPQVSADATEAIFQALQQKQLFGLTVVHQSDPAWRGLQLDLDSQYTPEQLTPAGKVLRCNAVLFGTVTAYQPYPHLAIGLRLKLVDLRDGRLLWALEKIWDSSDKMTESRIRNYFQCQIRSGYAPLREQLVVVSSLNFIKFVAYEVAETLRPPY